MVHWIGKRIPAAFIVAAALPFVTPPASALDINGFMREKGKGDVAVSYTSESYDQFYRGTMKVDNPPFLGEVTNWSASLWAAYGLTDNWTLVVSFPYVDSEGDGTDHDSQSGLQDFSALALYRFASVGTRVKSDFIGAIGGSTPMTNYDPNLPVSIGDGSTDLQARFVYMLRAGAFYWSQQVGYDLRGDDVPDGVPLYTEVGYTAGRTTFNGFYARLFANGGSDIGDPGFTFPGNQEEYQRAGAKVYVRITDRFGIAVAGYGTLDGRNTGDSSGASLGFNVGF